MDILSYFDRRTYAKCITCGQLIKTDRFFEVSGNMGICSNCNSHLPIVPVGLIFDEKGSPLSYSASVFYYRAPVRDLIIDFKFNSCTSYGNIFAAYMRTYATTLVDNSQTFDLIIPVPLSAKRFEERGYNQAALLSEPLAAALGIQHCTEALFRTRNTARQSSLLAWNRGENLEGAFRANKSIVKDKSVLLIDDVYTTGTTVKECARTLYNAGASHICAYTLARRSEPRKSKEYNELINS